MPSCDAGGGERVNHSGWGQVSTWGDLIPHDDDGDGDCVRGCEAGHAAACGCDRTNDFAHCLPMPLVNPP